MKKYILGLGITGIVGITEFYSCTEPKIEPTPNYSVETSENNPKNSSQPYVIKREPSTPKPSKKEPIKKSSQKQNAYPEPSQNQPYPALPYSVPKSSKLEEALEEEEELAWYDLPPEKRDFKTPEEVRDYIIAALNARDYKVAESYLSDFQKVLPPEEYKQQKKVFPYVITSNYDEFLTGVINNCEKYDQDSVFRKVLWMNFFAEEHQDIFPIPASFNPYTGKDIDLAALLKKGEQALNVVEHCPEKKYE